MANYSGVVVSSGGLVVSSGESAAFTEVLRWGSMYVSGGYAEGTMICPDGIEFVDSGGVDSGAAISGYYYLENGMYAYAKQQLYYGGSAIGATLGVCGRQEVYWDGFASDTLVQGLGYQVIYCNGVARGTVASGYSVNYNGNNYGYVARILVSSGGIASDSVLMNICRIVVYQGGSAVNTFISSGVMSAYGTVDATTVGGLQFIMSGGVARNTRLIGTGYQEIYYGGVAEDTTILQGYQYVLGGKAVRTVLSGGGQAVIDGTVESTRIIHGYQRLESAMANNTIIESAARQYVNKFGAAFKTVVMSGGSQIVSGDGYAWKSFISAGGYQIVYGGGMVADTYIAAGGKTTLYSSATIASTLTLAGTLAVLGPVTLDGVDMTLELTSPNSTAMISVMDYLSSANSYTVKSDDTIAMGSYLLATGCSGFDGVITIIDGGIEVGTVSVAEVLRTDFDRCYILSVGNGRLTLSKDIIRQSVMLFSGGTKVYGGPLIYDAVLEEHGSADSMCVYLGGSALNTSIGSGGRQTVYGVASGATITSGGLMEVFSGGRSVSGTVKSEAVALISGGEARNFRIESGGYLVASSGALLTETTVAFGGSAAFTSMCSATNLVVESGGRVDAFRTVISGMSVASGGYVSLSAATLTGDVSLAGTLFCSNTIYTDNCNISLRVDRHTADDDFFCSASAFDRADYTVVVADGDQPDGTYKLLSNIGYHRFTITINTVSGDTVGTMWWPTASSMFANDRLYTLEAGSGGLTLTIDSTIPICMYKDDVLVERAKWAYNLTVAESDSVDRLVVSSGGIVSGVTIGDGGEIYAGTGAVISSTGVYYGGRFYANECTAERIDIWSGGEMYAESGAQIKNIIISKAGKAFVTAQAMVNGVSFNGAGDIWVSSGGIVTGAIRATIAGNVWIEAGGMATDAELYGIPQVTVQSGGVVSGTAIGSQTHVYVSSGGEVRAISLLPYGSMTVYSGGLAEDIDIRKGYVWLKSGATVAGELTMFGIQTIEFGVDFSGADIIVQPLLPSSTDAATGDWSVISSARSYTVRCDFWMPPITYVLSNIGGAGFDRAITVIDKGVVQGTVSLGASPLVVGRDTYYLGLTVSGGLTLTKEHDAFQVQVYNSSGILIEDATELIGYVFSYEGGARMDIYSGGTAIDTVMSSYYGGGSQNVYDGGVASGTLIYNGVQRIYSGGYAFATRISGYPYVYYGNCQYVSAGGVASRTTMVGNGAMQCIDSGAAAYETYIGSGTRQIVSEGGLAWNTVIESGGARQEVSRLGMAQYTEIRASGVQEVAGIAFFTAVSSAGTQYILNGGSVEDVIVSSGGKLSIASGASAVRVVLESGAMLSYDFNAKLEAVSAGKEVRLVSSESYDYEIRETQIVSSRYTSLQADIMTGGVMSIEGGTAYDPVVHSNGNLRVSQGGIAYNVLLGPEPGHCYAYAGSGGLISGIMVQVYGHLSIASGGVVYDAQTYGSINVNGGELYNARGMYNHIIAYQGKLYGTVMCGAMLSVHSAEIYRTEVISYSNLHIYGSGIEYGTIWTGAGSYTVYGKSYDATIKTGVQNLYGVSYSATLLKGVQYVGPNGSAYETVISSGGNQCVSSGGFTSGTVVYSGGTQVVSSGGIASDTVVKSGGIQSAYGTADGMVVEYGGQAVVCGYVSGNIVVRGCLDAGNSVALSGTAVTLDLCCRGNDDDALVIGTYGMSKNTTWQVDVYQAGVFQLVSGGTALWTDAVEMAIYREDEQIGVLSRLRQSIAVGEFVYTLINDSDPESGILSLSVSGNFKEYSGRMVGNDAELSLENSTVSGLIAGATQNVGGKVAGRIALIGYNTCNIYGGGTDVSVGGSIALTVSGDYQDTYAGLIYGGSLAAGSEVATGNITLSVGTIAQTANMKMIKRGSTAWLVGGGGAISGGTISTGAVSMEVAGTRTGYLVGGAQAQGDGSIATVASTCVTISNAYISGDIFGGGYAYDHGVSTVSGDASLRFDTSLGEISVVGNIYGGGANPSHPSQGGSSVVEGNSRVTFTGNAGNLMIGLVSGDGKVEGSVKGVKTLSFADFTGEFVAVVKNFDEIRFSGTTSMTYVGEFTAQTIAFDLTGRDAGEWFADGFGFTDGGDNLLKIELGDSTGSFDLMTCDDFETLEGLKVELYKSGLLYASFDYGETAKGYTVTERNGCLALLA